jgi:hypothetical protein
MRNPRPSSVGFVFRAEAVRFRCWAIRDPIRWSFRNCPIPRTCRSWTTGRRRDCGAKSGRCPSRCCRHWSIGCFPFQGRRADCGSCLCPRDDWFSCPAPACPSHSAAWTIVTRSCLNFRTEYRDSSAANRWCRIDFRVFRRCCHDFQCRLPFGLLLGKAASALRTHTQTAASGMGCEGGNRVALCSVTDADALGRIRPDSGEIGLKVLSFWDMTVSTEPGGHDEGLVSEPSPDSYMTSGSCSNGR